MAPLMRTIPSTGEQIAAVGLGTWQSFDIGTDRRDRAACRAVLESLFAEGGTLIDSSPMYRRAEAVVGDLLSPMAAHDKAFIATKVWTSGGPEGRAQMEASFAKLQTEIIDLMQVHNLVDWQTHWPLLQDWKAAGRLRYIGITHYTADSVDGLADVVESTPMDFVQCGYSVGDRAAERRLLPLCADRGVAVLANRPLQEGTAPRRLQGQPLPAWADEVGCVSWSDLMLKFILSNPAITCAIPATRNVDHMAANLRAAAAPLLDALQCRQLADRWTAM